MKFIYGFLLILIGIVSMAQTQTIETEVLPIRSNNWLSIQGGGDWEGLSDNQIHKRQFTFDNPEYGIRAGVISLMTRALRKNNETTLNINQIFFEDDGWAEDKQSYKMDLISRGIPEDKFFDMLDRKDTTDLINFIASHEMGRDEYNAIKGKDEIINKGIDMAYEYILSPDYSKHSQLVGE